MAGADGKRREWWGLMEKGASGERLFGTDGGGGSAEAGAGHVIVTSSMALGVVRRCRCRLVDTCPGPLVGEGVLRLGLGTSPPPRRWRWVSCIVVASLSRVLVHLSSRVLVVFSFHVVVVSSLCIIVASSIGMGVMRCCRPLVVLYAGHVFFPCCC